MAGASPCARHEGKAEGEADLPRHPLHPEGGVAGGHPPPQDHPKNARSRLDVVGPAGFEEEKAGNGIRTRDPDLGKVVLYH